MSTQGESRFDWPAIFRVSGIIIAGPLIIGFLIPFLLALALNVPVRVSSANEIYRWAYWLVAWGLTVWQGAWMLREVHDRIIDDMLVTAAITGVVLLIIRVIISLVFDPRPDYVDPNNLGDPLPLITAIDAGGALIMAVVGLVGARVNKY